MKFILTLFIIWWALLVAMFIDVAQPTCDTDTECMALCRADDPGCDGGPE